MYEILSNGEFIEIHVDKDELDLDKTFNCGQAFRWSKESSGEWVGILGNKIVVLKQIGSTIYTNLSEEYSDMIVQYLNLDMSYIDEVSKIDLIDYERRAYYRAKGIHILRQDLFETIVTFMMSSCNIMTNIRRIVNMLCEVYGEELTEYFNGDTYTLHAFPTLEKLSGVGAYEFRAFSMGFRANYLYDFCQFLCENTDFLKDLKECSYKDCIKKLKRLNGIGDKVANCIALFSLHHIEAFPIDTHINAIIQQEYNGNIDLSRYNNIAGIMQQYMFYYKAFS